MHEVDAAAEKLDERDPNVAAVKARAAIARGRYGPAEALLRPVVQRAPTSEAALELGLLEQMMGRDSATPILEKVATLADTSDNPAEVARGARALRALLAASRKPTPRTETPRRPRQATRRSRPAGASCSSRSTCLPRP